MILFLLGAYLNVDTPAKICSGVHPLESVSALGSVTVRSVVPLNCRLLFLALQVRSDDTPNYQFLLGLIDPSKPGSRSLRGDIKVISMIL